MEHFADRLTTLVRRRGNPLCVGLDPRWDSLPRAIQERHGGDTPEKIAAGYEEFCLRVLDIVAPLVPVVKPQSAFFEACGPAGVAVMQRLIERARNLGLLVILDSKRGDIASTATAYAEASFDRLHADAITINPYLGRDAVEPFLQSARRCGGGVFVLVRTSNPGSGLFQDLLVNDAQNQPRPLYVHVGAAVRAWTRDNLGTCGLGDVGAVVGATYPDELRQLRQQMPEVPLLVPGYGAQGGTAQDVAAAFLPDGSGAVVNSSRGILFPFKPDEANWEQRIEAATRQTTAALKGATASA